MTIIKKYSILLFGTIIILTGCINDKSASSEDKSASFELIRFDNHLMNLDTLNLQEDFTALYEKHSAFMDVYFSSVLTLPGYNDDKELFFTNLRAFITDKRIMDVHHLINEEFGSFSEEKKELNIVFQKAKEFFPDLKEPNIYTYLSEFSLQRFIFEDNNKDGLAIGLDLFLGENFDYSRLEQGSNSFSNYLTRTFNKEHLIKKIAESWLEDQMGLQSGNRLIDHMIYNGKKLYLLDKIIDEADSIKLEYTVEQLDWIHNNEKEMWAFYFENDWFYTTDQYVIKRLVFQSPNSTAIGMPAAAPGQTGNYLGWKIVESYMKRYPETDFSKLNQIEAQRLLELSKYKPGI